MTTHDATETAYKNGYEAGKRDAMKWIPVTERLPGHGSRVLCITQYRFKYEVMQWDGTAESWYAKDGRRGRRYATHWMPLPLPPKEVEG